jgi:hypothetical protein
LLATNPMPRIAEFFVWHFGMALFRPRTQREIVKSITRRELSSICHTKLKL